jgi:hypothetical protein
MCKFFKTIYNLHLQVITNGNGISSKSYVMIMGIWIGFEVTQVMLALTILDYVKTKQLNYTGITLLLGGISVLILAAAWGKIKTDMAYNGFTDNSTTAP